MNRPRTFSDVIYLMSETCSLTPVFSVKLNLKINTKDNLILQDMSRLK